MSKYKNLKTLKINSFYQLENNSNRIEKIKKHCKILIIFIKLIIFKFLLNTCYNY